MTEYASFDRSRFDPEPFTDRKAGFAGWRLRLEAGRGIPTPALTDTRVLVGGGFGSYDFYALDAKSGAILWDLRTDDDGPTAAVVADGVAVFNTESCTLEVVDVESGDIAWSRWLGDPLLAQPAVDGARVFMVYPHGGAHYLGAFRLADGEPLWTARLDHDVITAPVAVDGGVYLSTLDGHVALIDGASGRVQWRRQMRATSAPWVSDGEVYVAHRAEERARGGRDPHADAGPGDGYGPRERTSKLDAGSGRARGVFEAKAAPYLAEHWGLGRKAAFGVEDAGVGFAQAPSSAKLGIASGLIGESLVSRTWRYQGSRPVVLDGVLYDTTGDRLEARDAVTGDLRWRWENARAEAGERRLTPPAVANGRIWAGTWDGHLMSWDARSGQVRWRVEVGAPCHWQPAIKAGRVCAGLEDGTIVMLETGDPLDDGWPMWGGGAGHNGR